MAVLLSLVLYRFFPLLSCLDACFVDFRALHGGELLFELADTRLNAWILAWVQHSLLTDPTAMFEANSFYPVRNALTGSEHLIGVALQSLVFRLFSSNAVLLHQISLLLSSALLAVTSFLFVSWLTGSIWASFIASVAAILMPWRMTELGHVQFLSAQFFPLVWLWVSRFLLVGASWRAVGLLSAVLALQLLSSFYLAYFLTFSLAVLGVAVLIQQRVMFGTIGKLVVAAIPAYAVLAICSVPYLSREASIGLALPLPLWARSAPPEHAWGYIAPKLGLASGDVLNADPNYSIPLGVGLLALAALAYAVARRKSIDLRDRRVRIMTLSFWALAVSAFVMMMGLELRIGERSILLPSYWAEKIVPGFSNLRGPTRWGILIGLALPVLAGIGAWSVERVRPRWIVGVRVAVALLVFATLPWVQIPARQVWEHPDQIRTRYEAVRALPEGPLVEIPWTANAAAESSGYLLASTLHWRRILNGYTGHLPPSYHFLRRTGERLPEQGALERVRALSGVRWAVLDLDAIAKDQISLWERAVADGRIEEAYSDEHTAIYQLRDWETGGAWIEPLISPERRSRTFSGLPRSPLPPEAQSGNIEAGIPRVFGLPGSPASPIEIRVRNDSEIPWPGFDVQTEGLVQLRYTFAGVDGQLVETELAPLDVDVPGKGTESAFVNLASPKEPGVYRLCLDLVQELEGEYRGLAIPPLESRVRVIGRDSASGGWALWGERLKEYQRSKRSIPPCGTRG